ncbi:MAG: hypothetical protein EOO10_23140 [Chitinophagaceae bacterium]|nr:MAG: hypothetical protein EOO10_23140 [Chitinophagaceae bacterium]
MIVFVFSAFAATAQVSTLSLKDRLVRIDSIPFWYTPLAYDDAKWKTYRFDKPVPLKGVDSNYASIVKRGKTVIPELINFLGDTTSTSILNRCDSGYVTIGQLAYFLINDIEFIPVPLVTRSQWCVMSECQLLREGFLEYLRLGRDDFKKRYNHYFYSKMRRQHLNGTLKMTTF